MGNAPSTTAVQHANAMPAATWHFLRMNDADIELPGMPPASDCAPVSIEGAAAAPQSAHDAFERAVSEAAGRWCAEHPAPTAEQVAAREARLAAEADATYGGTALSAYQAAAEEAERAGSLPAEPEHGMGAEAAALLREAAGAGNRVVVAAGAGETVDAHVVIAAAPGALSAGAIDVVAERGSAVNLAVLVAGEDAASAGGTAAGVTGTTMRVFAGPDARVSIVRTQALGAGYTDLDDTGVFADERARIDVRHTVLGAGRAFTGLAADLRGDSSRINIATNYLGQGEQELDFNYIVRHHGPRTECDLKANGVLAGKSRKILRGTIDLIRGAKGAQGNESENVLLVDEGVRNKTVPVILCNEDDVAGNHGATIGHIRADQLFYLSSRGLSAGAAEQMLASAFMEQAALDAPDEASRTAVVRLGEQRHPGFAAWFEEEA